MSILLILVGTGFIIYMSLDMFKSQFGKGMGADDEHLKEIEEELRDAPPVVYYEDPQKDGLTTILNDGDIYTSFQWLFNHRKAKIECKKRFSQGSLEERLPATNFA